MRNFNKNNNREQACTKEEEKRMKVVFPKYKDDFSVKAISEDATFEYVDKLMKESMKLFEQGINGLATAAVPLPLTSEKRKPSRQEALGVVTTRTRKLKRDCN